MQTTKKDPTPAGQSAHAGRKPYHPPLLTEEGSLRELTRTTAAPQPYYDSGTDGTNIYSSTYYY